MTDFIPFGDLTGKTAVVTGSSSGIGRAIALELALGGAHVLIHARRNGSAAEETASQVCAAGVESRVLLANLAEPAQQDQLVEQAWAWRGGIDLWINNAGADVLTGDAASWPFERKLEQLWRVDVVGTMRLSRQVGARLKARGQRESGVIINVGWDQAEQGMEGDSGEMFAAIKGAVMCFTRSLACSLAPEVRVNCVAPGWIRTAWGEDASPYWQSRAERESLLARWGTPQDVARMVRFLASSSASFTTGQIVPVNGGFRHRS